MAENYIGGVFDGLLKGMDTVLSAKTVVGEPMQVGDSIVLPLVDVTFGMGAGAGTNAEKKANKGAGGIGGKMSPSAVLIIGKNGTTRLVNIKNQDTITKVLDMAPDLIERFVAKKDTLVSDEEAVETAFPEESAE